MKDKSLGDVQESWFLNAYACGSYAHRVTTNLTYRV